MAVKKAKLLDDKGLTDALEKLVRPRFDWIKEKMSKTRNRDELFYAAKEVSEANFPDERGYVVDLIGLSLSEGEREKYKNLKYSINYESSDNRYFFMKNSYHPASETIFSKINLYMPRTLVTDYNWKENKDKFFKDMDRFDVSMRHEATHALRDMVTNHLKTVTKMQEKDIQRRKRYLERGHLDEEYEIDAIINGLDRLRRKLGKSRWDDATVSDIMRLLPGTRLPMRGDPAWSKWVKRLYREGLLTSGMKREWGLRNERSIAAGVMELARKVRG